MSDCLILGAPCYAAEYFEDMTSDEICTKAEADEADVAICGGMEDCASCVGAVKSDGMSTCMWFEGEGYCGIGCSMNGCGVDTCAATGETDATTTAATTAAAGSGTTNTDEATGSAGDGASKSSSGRMNGKGLASICAMLLVGFASTYAS